MVNYSMIEVVNFSVDEHKRGCGLRASISPGREYGLSAPREGVTYNYLIQKDRAELELYISIPTSEENKALF